MRFLQLSNISSFTKFLGKNKIEVQTRRFLSALQRQNFSNECENAINKQINLELSSSYAYLAMAYFCDSVALKGAYKFFKKASDDETAHAHQFMEYLNKRGGQIVLSDIEAPRAEFKTLMDTLNEALKLELDVNKSLLELHEVASKEGDPNLCDFIEANFLQEQIDAQKQLADYIQELERAETCVGTYIFDRHLAKGEKMH